MKAAEKLKWELSEKTVLDIAEASEAARKDIARAHLSVLCLPGYGKTLWKAYKTSPDAIIQAALQLTYFQLHGQIAPTYESGIRLFFFLFPKMFHAHPILVSTRTFARGRTETGRSVTNELVKFVKSMENPSIPVSTLKF